MNDTNIKPILFLLCFLPLSINVSAADNADQGPVDPKIKSVDFRELRKHLTGTWVGEFTNGTLENPDTWNPIEVQYLLSGNGSAIIENYFYGQVDVPGMTTVYYPDGADLQLTHYCGAQNHPRMKRTTYDKNTRTYAFRFLDITNLQDQSDYHSRSLDLTFVTDDEIRITYAGDVNGKTAFQTYRLVRKMAD